MKDNMDTSNDTGNRQDHAPDDGDRGAVTQTDQPDGLPGFLDQLLATTNGENVTLGDVVKAFGNRSFGPLLLVPAIIAVAPTGAIPGMSILTGSIVLLICLQMLAGRNHTWLPDRLPRFEFARKRLKDAVDTAKPYAKRINRFVGHRVELLASPPASYLVPAVCALLALLMFPLALLPFAVAVPGTAIAIFAIGLTFKDGLMIALGYGVAIIAGYITWVAFIAG